MQVSSARTSEACVRGFRIFDRGALHHSSIFPSPKSSFPSTQRKNQPHLFFFRRWPPLEKKTFPLTGTGFTCKCTRLLKTQKAFPMAFLCLSHPRYPQRATLLFQMLAYLQICQHAFAFGKKSVRVRAHFPLF